MHAAVEAGMQADSKLMAARDFLGFYFILISDTNLGFKYTSGPQKK